MWLLAVVGSWCPICIANNSFRSPPHLTGEQWAGDTGDGRKYSTSDTQLLSRSANTNFARYKYEAFVKTLKLLKPGTFLKFSDLSAMAILLKGPIFKNIQIHPSCRNLINWKKIWAPKQKEARVADGPVCHGETSNIADGLWSLFTCTLLPQNIWREFCSL